MHPSAYEELEKFSKTLPGNKVVLIGDVGSYDVNGTLRPIFAKPPWIYHGIDMAAGPNVDIVVEGEKKWAIADNTYDVMVTVSTLEHTRFPWLVVAEMARIAKPGAIFCICAPYMWPYHAHPIDCWRIFPDGLKAIMELAGLVVDEVHMKVSPGHPCTGDTIAIGRKPL